MINRLGERNIECRRVKGGKLMDQVLIKIGRDDI